MTDKTLPFHPKTELFGPRDCGPLGETLMPCIFEGYRHGQTIIITKTPKEGPGYPAQIDDIHAVPCPPGETVRYMPPPAVRQYVETEIVRRAQVAMAEWKQQREGEITGLRLNA